MADEFEREGEREGTKNRDKLNNKIKKSVRFKLYPYLFKGIKRLTNSGGVEWGKNPPRFEAE